MHRYGILWCTLLFSGILSVLLSRIFSWNYFYDYFDYGTSLFSALTVRYLTRRFIGEYDSEKGTNCDYYLP